MHVHVHVLRAKATAHLDVCRYLSVFAIELFQSKALAMPLLRLKGTSTLMVERTHTHTHIYIYICIYIYNKLDTVRTARLTSTSLHRAIRSGRAQIERRAIWFLEQPGPHGCDTELGFRAQGLV